MTEKTEALADELQRLVNVLQGGDTQNHAEAWNLIADFAVENVAEITEALRFKEAAHAAYKSSAKIADDECSSHGGSKTSRVAARIAASIRTRAQTKE